MKFDQESSFDGYCGVNCHHFDNKHAERNWAFCRKSNCWVYRDDECVHPKKVLIDTKNETEVQ